MINFNQLDSIQRNYLFITYMILEINLKYK